MRSKRSSQASIILSTPKEHLYWWETERDAAIKSGTLNMFLSNYCATPEESFQHVNVAAFPPEILEKLRLQTKIGIATEFIPTVSVSAS